MNDRDIVDAFVAHLAQRGVADLKVDRRPDEENRTSSDIDAVAGPFAIEHTSIDTVPNQRRDSGRFMRVIGGLEDELRGALPFRLSIAVDYDAISVGQDWVALRAALRLWILTASRRLADGLTIVKDGPGIPFELRVVKTGGTTPGLFVRRFAPGDDTLSVRVHAAFTRKAKKLAPYKASGMTTVLLVENGDSTLMNESTLIEAIRGAFSHGLPASIDQVWFADTSLVKDLLFVDFTPALHQAVV